MRNYLSLKQFGRGRKNNLWITLETIVITGVVLGLCYWSNPKNPLFLRGIFPWPWIASVIIVLRYGFGFGFLSAIIIIGAIFFNGPPGAVLMPDYQNYILSGLALTLFCGLFSSSATKRYVNAEAMLAYSQEKLDNLSRSYYLMNISHNNLAQNLITQPITIRSVMAKLKKLLLQQSGQLTPELAYQFLQLICQNCSISIAGIYAYENNALQVDPLAEMGNMGRLEREDPILKNALKTKETSYINSDQTASTYLIAVPMYSNSGKLLAMLVVKEMGFKALTKDTLRILNILVSYFVEEMSMPEEIMKNVNQYPDCPVDFLKELHKLIILKEKINIDSSLVAMIVDKNLRSNNIIYDLTEQKRTLDTNWLYETEKFDVIIVLMPLTDAAGIQGYFHRTERFLISNHGLKIDQQQIKTRSLQLMPVSDLLMIEKIIKLIEDATC